MSQVLEEYLVKLGALTDETSFGKFSSVLEGATTSVGSFALQTAQSFIKVQAGIIGAFSSISAAVLDLVDKTVSAEVSTRIYGESMLMTTDAARKMKLVTGELGLSLQQIRWDPVSSAKARVMEQDIDAWKQSATGFEEKMAGLEAMQFQVTRLRLAFKLLARSFSASLFDQFGGSDLGRKLSGWVDDLFKGGKIQKFGEMLAKFFAPVLKETWNMFVALGEAVKTFADDFSLLIGIISGDDSIDNSADSFTKLGKALSHVISWAATFIQVMSNITSFIAHLIASVLQLGKALKDFFSGNFSDFTKDVKSAGSEFNTALNNLVRQRGEATAEGLFDSVVGGASEAAKEQKVPQPPSAKEQESAQSGASSPQSGASSPQSGDAFEGLFNAIQRQEGYRPGTLAYRNNNPMNIEFHQELTRPGWVEEGAVRGEGGRFAKFPTYEAGKHAALMQLGIYARRGKTLAEAITAIAPKNENDTATYIKNVSAWSGVSPDARLSSLSRGSVSVNVSVNVAHANASPRDIETAATRGTLSALRNQSMIDMAQIAGNHS